MSCAKRLVAWWKWRNRIALHPCDMCKRMMRSNGYGLCEECLDVSVYATKDDYCIYMAKHRPDMRQIG